MQADSEELYRAEASGDPYFGVRIYAWQGPAISIGRHQDVETVVDSRLCRELGVEIVRRPTGGRTVLHFDELTYSVVVNRSAEFFAPSIGETYRRIGEVLCRALAAVGVDVEIERRRPGNRSERGLGRLPCFQSTSRHELVCGGRKLAGSAQRRLKRSLLQHGSIPLRIDYPFMARLLGTDSRRLRASMISVEEAAGRPVPFEELAAAVQQEFVSALDL